MFPNPSIASLFSTSTTHYTSQSKINSCSNENVSMPANIYMNPSYIYQTNNTRQFNEQSPIMFDSTIGDNLSPDFMNLFLYERIWSPVNSKTTKTTTTKETTTKSSNVTIKQMGNTMNASAFTPIAQSTPRAIRKRLNADSEENKPFIFEAKKPDQTKTNENSNGGTLRPKKQESDKPQTINHHKKKYAKKQSNEKNFSNSSAYNSANSSPNSSKSFGKRNLPLRSQGIDLSGFLNKQFDNSSIQSNSSTGYCSSDYSLNNSKTINYRNKNIQNKCLFCENNGESEEIYMSHPLKDSLGKVVCPILRNFTCPKCGESGDYAHTNKYCPETQRKQKENKIKKFFNQKDF